MTEEKIYISEIFQSIQGESSFAGLPCIFIRTGSCNLKCRYCDTAYARNPERQMSVGEILEEISPMSPKLICVTGGEPLAQMAAKDLLPALPDKGKQIILETNGTYSLAFVDERINIVMDIKTPGSGEAGKTDWENLNRIKSTDQIKFVLVDEEDYRWSCEIIKEHKLTERFQVLLAPAFKYLEPAELSHWILRDELDVRLNLQIHKYIWPPEQRGV